jgi:hypothetical protein
MRIEECFMASTTLAERVAALEAEVARLKSKIEAVDSPKPWWEQIAGTFQNDPIYDQAMWLGRQYRQSLQPKSPTRRKQ